jgi:prepilin-type processing-associated H-X9-DG protein
MNGTDLLCEQAPPGAYTGPNEVWWSPYDNRPGTTPTQALPGYVPTGLVFPFVEGNRKVFQCPDGIDVTPGSPTAGQPYQVSYALNYVSGGPANLPLVLIRTGTSQVLLGWEHSNVPICAYQAPGSTVRIPWPFNDSDVNRHYAPRHNQMFNMVYCDGHVAALGKADLPSQVFLAF